MRIIRVTKKNRPGAGRVSRQGFLTPCRRNGMQTRPFLFAKLFFTSAWFVRDVREKERGKHRRSSAISRHLDHALSCMRQYHCTTNPCNNLAPRRRVKCANVGNRHESVRKPVELQPSLVIKYEERRYDVGLKSSSDGRRWASGGRQNPRGRGYTRGDGHWEGGKPFKVISSSHATFNIEGCFLTFSITLGGGF